MAISAQFPIKRKIFISHFVAVILVSGSIGTYFYLSATGDLMNAIRSRLINSAAIISRTLDARSLEGIRGPFDMDSAAYLKTLEHLRILKRTNKDIAFLYIMRRQADDVVFVVDSDETDAQAKPGDVYTPVPEELLKGFEAASVDREIIPDQWGHFLSGYSPLPGGDGRYLVGMDMRADELGRKLKSLRVSGWISLGCSLLLALVFSRYLGSNLVRRIELLTLQCRAVAHGEVGDCLDYRKGDELDTLIHAFNAMSEQLAGSRDESRQSQEALARSRDDLEIKVSERTRDLRALNDKLSQEISDRKRTETEKEALIAELQVALAQVKTLRGLLPICASCKKVRDDKGYWSQIEIYVADHSEAEFSHGICPDCVRRLYPDAVDVIDGPSVR
ncbi:MAG: HAMP domain-containing protein [Pseudomonadota bacterium]